MRFVLPLLLALSALLPSPAAAQPPLGSYVVSAEPGLYETVLAGATGWNDSGAVWFTVVADGCWTGDVFFCLSWETMPGAVAGWDYATPSRVHVSPTLLHLFTPAVVCHELGHFLGLRWYADGSVYHRTDYASCMTDPYPTVAAPDAIDLAFLGVEVAPDAPEPEPEPAPNADKRIVSLPDTGTGSAYAG